MRPGRRRRTDLFSLLTLGALSYHASAMVLLHLVARDVNPVTDMIGAYLAGPHQLLARSTFLALACALAFLGLALVGRLPAGALARVAMGLLVIASAGFFGVAAAPEAARVLAAPTRPATVISILLLSLALRQQPQWRGVGRLLLGIGTALVALFVVTVGVGTAVLQGYGGLANRVVLALIDFWLLLVASRTLLMPPIAPAGGA